MRISVIGAGLIGIERIEALLKIGDLTHGSVRLESIYDYDSNRSDQLSGMYNARICRSIDEVFEQEHDWIFICTPHDQAKDISSKALMRGNNVLVEKPLGRSLLECDEILQFLKPDQQLKVGFNYRFYAGIEAIIHDAATGRFGELISVNISLGHGNSPGMEKTWKLDPIRCGGGCLIDPGIHLLDLILLLAQGEITINGGKTWSGFWNTGIEEEAHLLFSDSVGVVFNMQVSLNRWRSIFRLEINGTEGYGVVEGRGRSYGPQSYRVGKRWGWQGGGSQAESESIVIASDKGEDTFLKETALVLGSEIAQQVLLAQPPLTSCDAKTARKTMDLLERCRRTLLVNDS